ncbi:MAG: extracellular solute-binding protein [bacterium]|nr:extracellular solute-binding protein [bacterium]
MRTIRRGTFARAGVLVAALALLAASCAADDSGSEAADAAMAEARSASSAAAEALSEAQATAAAARSAQADAATGIADAAAADAAAQAGLAASEAAQAAAEAAQAAADLAQATAEGNEAAVAAAEAALADAQAAAEEALSEAAAAQAEAAAAQAEADEAREAAAAAQAEAEAAQAEADEARAEAAAAAAAAAEAEAAAAAVDPITLEFWSWNNEGAYPVVHEQAEERFEAAFPHVDVVRTYTPFADYMTNLRAAIAAGEPPDVAQVPWTGEYTDLVNGGAIASLAGDFTTGFPEFFPPIASIASVNGVPFAIPLDVNSLQIAYNKDIFAELGLEVPRSSDALKAVAAALDEAGYFGVAVGTNDGWAAADLFFAQLAYTDPTNTLIVQADAGAATWDDPQFLAAAENLEDLIANGVFAPGANSMVSFVGALELFVAQQAAMFYPVGNFITGGIAAQVEDSFEWGLFPFPSPDGGEGFATGGVAEMFSIPADAANVDMGIEFMRWLTDAESEASLVSNDFIPSWGIELPDDVSNLYRDLIAAQATVRNRTIYTTPVYTEVINGAQGLLGGTISAADMIEAMAGAG